jgi:hypothetical protein
MSDDTPPAVNEKKREKNVDQQGANGGEGGGNGDHQPGFKTTVSNPVVLITLVIVGAVCFQILLGLLGWDHGVVANMGRGEYARGFITYLFAMVTIGTAVVLVVSALTGGGHPLHDKRFDRGKQVLSLLLGVFGTIVGFYFGSAGQTTASLPHLAALRISHSTAPTNVFTVTTYVNGGKSPYKFAVAIGAAPEGIYEAVPENGWIVEELDGKQFPTGAPTQIAIVVKDADGNSARQTATMVNQP